MRAATPDWHQLHLFQHVTEVLFDPQRGIVGEPRHGIAYYDGAVEWCDGDNEDS